MEEYKAKTMEAYKIHAEEYAEKYKSLTDFSRRYEFKMFLELLEGSNVLDVGCGSGDHALYFESKGLNVSCIDLSPEMVKICWKKGLNAKIMDMEKLAFSPESFNGVWSVTSLIHIKKPDARKIAEDLYNILAKNGILFICVKKGEGEHFIKDEKTGTERFFSFWEEKELQSVFAGCFDVLDSRVVNFNGQDFVQVFFRKKS